MLSKVFRAIRNGNVPASISELLTTRNSSYDLLGDAILKLPKVNSTTMGFSRGNNKLPDYGTLFLTM